MLKSNLLVSYFGPIIKCPLPILLTNIDLVDLFGLNILYDNQRDVVSRIHSRSVDCTRKFTDRWPGQMKQWNILLINVQRYKYYHELQVKQYTVGIWNHTTGGLWYLDQYSDHWPPEMCPTKMLFSTSEQGLDPHWRPTIKERYPFFNLSTHKICWWYCFYMWLSPFPWQRRQFVSLQKQGYRFSLPNCNLAS